MKAVFVLFDSLNRHMLGAYGGTRVPTPNFDRLAARSLTFDTHYVGSLPCMPARRDMLTGRLTFLHRSWGPLEPFDNAFPELLHNAGVYSHLITDHFHYWEDGGATYHNRYDTYEFVRGQEGDPWKAMVQPHWERLREMYHARQFTTERREYFSQNIINREFIREEKDFPSVQCFAHGFEFLDRNRDADNWLLQIETFDPHEPFTAPARFKQAFDTGWTGPIRDWPRYGRVDELPEECEELRANYYAIVSMCDFLMGELLDYFDKHDLWKDTALVVTTDHGFLLGEHDFWAKNRMNLYEEIAHIPLFLHDPRQPRNGERCAALTQAVDLAPTFLDLFGVASAPEMEGRSLLAAARGMQLREAALFGYFGGAVNVADGRYTYHRFPADLNNQEIYQYTLMPTHIFSPFSTEELSQASLSNGFPFTKGAKVLKVPVTDRSPMYNVYGPGALIENGTRLYDLVTDPGQERPLADPDAEQRLVSLMSRLMADNEAPPEAFARLGLPAPASRETEEVATGS
ncbi:MULTISPECIES: sulfatase [unclassified Chelatococcus]|uniref:sulfatase n=1 Tax=unclassified Chelatococcus TaxID=2638111 RepID=UPI001BCC6B0A|nr:MULTISPECIES: sulfatase [unclassified Chelatococcus]MBS7701004.1 sulfatase-like hydrolase/transferase [Chelatococcus sp. YT9]MBX3555537.1 sulfatase-like hydrolase/transferase [Chelatococcus sp.]